MLTVAQREEFERRGLLYLRGAVDPRLMADLRERVAQHLAATRAVPKSLPRGFAVNASVVAPLARRLDFTKTWGESVVAMLDELLGLGAWAAPPHAGQILMITWPMPGAEWTLPYKSWHLDYPAPAAARHIPGLQVFLFVDRIEPGGGGTLFASGSHRLVDALRRRHPPGWPGASREVRISLAREVPWLGALCAGKVEDRIARLMDRVTAWKGSELQVVEAVGEPGDVLAVHPWTLHAPAPNCGTRPRLLLTERIHRQPQAD